MLYKKIVTELFEQLHQSIESRKSEFHIANFGYNDTKNRTKIDCVVVRNIGPGFVWFHTDARSDKVLCLKKNPTACLHFYSKKDKLQASMHTKVTLHHQNEITAKQWSKLSNLSKMCYRQVGQPKEPYYPNLASQTLSDDEAYSNFIVVEAAIIDIDLLYLQLGDNIRYQISLENKTCDQILA